MFNARLCVEVCISNSASPSFQLCLSCFGELPDHNMDWIKIRNSLMTYEAVYCVPAFDHLLKHWFCGACPVNERKPLFVSSLFARLFVLSFGFYVSNFVFFYSSILAYVLSHPLLLPLFRTQLLGLPLLLGRLGPLRPRLLSMLKTTRRWCRIYWICLSLNWLH